MKKNTLLKVLDVVDTCIKAKSDPNDVAKILDKVSMLLPFERACVAVDNKSEFTLTSELQVFESNVRDSWKNIYGQQEYWRVDHVLAALTKSNSAISWQTATDICNDVNNEFKHMYQEYMGKDGLSIQVNGKEGLTILSLAMREDYIGAEEHQVLEYIAPHIHEVFNRSGEMKRQNLRAPKLTQREIEVLHWATEGKSTWDISTILSISERTVKFHFCNVFNKLDVINRSQAVAKAINYGLVGI